MTLQDKWLLKAILILAFVHAVACQATVAEARTAFKAVLSADIGLKAADNKPLGTRTPLILIHGWNSDSSKWSAFIHEEHPVNENYKVYLYSYDWSKHISESSADLRDEIESGRHFPVDRNFTIIAHSMGGLVARYYLEHPEWSGHERLDRLITLGTPHHGSPLANVAWLQNYTKLQSSLELLEQAKLLQHPTLLTFAILGVHGVNLAIKGAAQELVPLNSDGGYCLGWDNYDSTMPERVWNGSGATPAANRFTRELNESLASHPQRDEILERYTLVGSYFSIHESSGFNETLAGSLMASALTRDDGSDVRHFVANDGVVPLSSALFIKGYNQPVHVELDGKIAPHDNTFQTHAAASYAFFPDVVHGDLTSHSDVLEYVFGQLAISLRDSPFTGFGSTLPIYEYDGKFGYIHPGSEYLGVQLPGKWGFINRSGKVVIETQFDAILHSSEDLVCVQVGAKYGFIDITGKFIFQPQLEVPPRFSEGLVQIRVEQKWGYIDRTGKFIIQPQFDFADTFSEGLARVRFGDEWGFIDRTGNVVMKPEFDSVSNFSEGLAHIFDGGQIGLIDRTGRLVVEPQFDAISEFSEGLASFQVGGKWGCIDGTGKVVIEPQLDAIPHFSEGLASVKVADKYGFIDKTGTFVIQPRFDNVSYFTKGYAPVQVGSEWGYIDSAGRIVIMPQFDAAFSFSEGLAIIRTGEKCGVIDRTGRLVIEPRFDEAHRFSEGLAGVQVGGKWGFIDRTGRLVIEPQFDHVSSFSRGLTTVRISGKWGYIDKTGTMLTIKREAVGNLQSLITYPRKHTPYQGSFLLTIIV